MVSGCGGIAETTVLDIEPEETVVLTPRVFCGEEDESEVCQCPNVDRCGGPTFYEAEIWFLEPSMLELGFPYGRTTCGGGGVDVSFTIETGCAMLVAHDGWWVGSDPCPREQKCVHVGPGWARASTDGQEPGRVEYYPDPECKMSCR